MWLARVPIPAIPAYAVHQHLWGYFDLDRGEPRPFLYRVQGDGIAILSRIKPRCPAMNLQIEAGRVYTFEALLSPVNGCSRGKGPRAIMGNAERRAWIQRRFDGAADLTFVQFFDRENLQFRKGGTGEQITVWRCEVKGALYVKDRAAFAEALLRGPGKGKAWGCGLLWLPEIMG